MQHIGNLKLNKTNLKSFCICLHKLLYVLILQLTLQLVDGMSCNIYLNKIVLPVPPICVKLVGLILFAFDRKIVSPISRIFFLLYRAVRMFLININQPCGDKMANVPKTDFNAWTGILFVVQKRLQKCF